MKRATWLIGKSAKSGITITSFAMSAFIARRTGTCLSACHVTSVVICCQNDTITRFLRWRHEGQGDGGGHVILLICIAYENTVMNKQENGTEVAECLA